MKTKMEETSTVFSRQFQEEGKPLETQTSASGWTPAERELALKSRASRSIREISEILTANGFPRSPKSVEKFFERVGITREKARSEAGPRPEESVSEEDKIYQTGPLQTTWGEPMLVNDKSLEFGKGTSVVPVVFLPDIHAPFQDDRAIELACKIIELVRPVVIIYHGDNVDWSQISHFDKDPARLTKAQFEVDKFHELDRMFMSAAGKDIRRYYILGNHEYRLRAFHCKNPTTSEFRGLQFDAILGLGPTMKTIPNLQLVDGEINWRDKFIAKHGHAVRKWSGQSAKAELDQEHVNGISGHTHRAGPYYMTQRGKTQVWLENGCLCSLEPEYMKNPNWQHAVTVGYFNGDGQTDFFHLDQIVFSKYQAIVNGNYLKA